MKIFNITPEQKREYRKPGVAAARRSFRRSFCAALLPNQRGNLPHNALLPSLSMVLRELLSL